MNAGKNEAEEKTENTEKTREKEKRKPVPEKERKVEKEDIVEERIYSVPLSRSWIAPRGQRSPKAVRLLKSFVKRHMKTDEDSIKIANGVNERIWDRGIEKPPRKIRIRVIKDKEGIVTVNLAEED